MRIGLTLMCTAVLVAYLFNVSIVKYVVYPINAMAFLMERYFSVSEQERVRALPNLNIHTGDEVERLYHSLQKMIVDMALHIDQRLEQERRFARLTREFMLALAKRWTPRTTTQADILSASPSTPKRLPGVWEKRKRSRKTFI